MGTDVKHSSKDRKESGEKSSEECGDCSNRNCRLWIGFAQKGFEFDRGASCKV